MSDVDLKKHLSGNLVWFALGMIVAAVVGTIAAIGWLEGFVDDRLEAAKLQLPPGPPGKQGDPGPQGAEGPAGPPGLAGVTAIPQGAVVAFDLPGGCPADWIDLSETAPDKFARRTIVGRDPKDDDAIFFGYRETDGEEKHTLTIEEMPAHTHTYTYQAGDWGGNFQHIDVNSYSHKNRIDNNPNPNPELNSEPDGTGSVNSAGKRKPHNNMPPYIALYFCKKD